MTCATMISLLMAAMPAEAARTIPVCVKICPDQGPVTNLEPEVLDFRYRPEQGQCCIGLPDDPYKTIVGSDGGIYYDYGQRGPETYSNGMGVFGSRVLAAVQGAGEPGPTRQTLLDPRSAIVVTERDYGNWTLRQRAWAGSHGPDWIEGRVDFLWLSAEARKNARPAQLALHVGTTEALELDATRTKLFRSGPSRRIFCEFSRPCQPLAGDAGRTPPPAGLEVKAVNPVTIQRNWARPTVKCAPCFHHVLVGFGHPLTFQFPARPGEKFRVLIGLIEGWHPEAGIRPVDIRVEGKPVRRLDLVKEFGRNVPTVLELNAEDRDGDGRVTEGVWAVPGAKDRNTILSGLWVYPSSEGPATEDVMLGTNLGRPLAVIDADHAPASPRPLTLLWDLKPGDQTPYQLLVALPQGASAARRGAKWDAAGEYERAVKFWHDVDLPYDRVRLPDPAAQGLFDSCIRNIYQAREIKEGKPAFQVGPTCYRGTWAADGPFILEAVTYLGRADETRAGLESQVDSDTGPGGVPFSKKSGLRLWMIQRHAQLTGDSQWLEKMWPRVVREVNQIIAYREMTRSDPKQANFGLMPIGFGDGGLGGKHREYTNVYWTLSGLKAAIAMAKQLHKPEGSKWQIEFDDYWKVFDAARNRDKLVDAAGNTYVPVTMKGEQEQLPQRGAWAFLQSVFPGRLFDSDDALMLGTLAMLDANQREGLIFGTGWIPDGVWNYAGSFYGHAHLWLGHGRKAAATLYAFGNHASPLLCWREEQRPVGDPPRYVGDMPHNWASAEFIRLVRHLMILERDDELHLLEGMPRAWTKPGAVTCLEEIPTTFGPVSLSVTMAEDGKSAALDVDPPPRNRLGQLVVHLEAFGRPVAGVRSAGGEERRLPAEIDTGGPIHLQVRFK